jgi:hypothetical protein
MSDKIETNTTDAAAAPGKHLTTQLKNSSARAVTDGDTILGGVDVKTTPERAFRALNTEELERWWGSPDTYRMTEWKADLRVGGRWSVLVARR